MGNELIYLAGEEIHEVKPLPPYSDIVCRFLDDFSAEILHDGECKAYPDIVAVGFWARKGNIKRLKSSLGQETLRIGRGLAFHITPSNIPVQFIFSYMFGLLAGNANIVRVASKEYPQIKLLCTVLDRVLAREEYQVIRSMTAIVRYPKESSWTKSFSAQCQVRLIWGGDETIRNIREYPLPPRAVELTFADRYSVALIKADAVNEAEEKALQRLAQDFYNDTFLMDQNACSSPQLILWHGDTKSIESGKERFWLAVKKLAEGRYDFPPIKATSKYSLFCSNAVRFEQTGNLVAENNLLYRVSLQNISDDLTELRGSFGLFYEYDVKDLKELGPIMKGKMQTVTYYGIDPKALASMVLENGWLGIDRLVPIGKALDLDVIWDGYDIVEEMTRIVDVR